MGAGSQICIVGKSSTAHIGENTSIGPNVKVLVVDAVLTIGSRASFNNGTSVDAIKSSTSIESGVHVGSNCHVGAANHDWRLLGADNYDDFDSCPLKLLPTTVGRGCWICSNSVVVTGSALPQETIVPPFTKITSSTSFEVQHSHAGRPVFFPMQK